MSEAASFDHHVHFKSSSLSAQIGHYGYPKFFSMTLRYMKTLCHSFRCILQPFDDFASIFLENNEIDKSCLKDFTLGKYPKCGLNCGCGNGCSAVELL